MKYVSIIGILMACFALSTTAQDTCEQSVTSIQPTGAFTFTWLNTSPTSTPTIPRYEFTVDAATALSDNTVGTLAVKEETDVRILLPPVYVEGTDVMTITSPADAPFRLTNLTRVRDDTTDANTLTYDITADLEVDGTLTKNRYELVIRYAALYLPGPFFGESNCILYTHTAVTITVENPVETNEAPVFAPPNPRILTVQSGTAAGMNIGAAITATDPDGDILTYSTNTQNPTLWDVVPTTGQFRTQSAIPNRDLTETFTLTAADGRGGTDTIGVTITVTTTTTTTGPTTTPQPTTPQPTTTPPTPAQTKPTRLVSPCRVATYHPKQFGIDTPRVFISAIEVDVEADNRNRHPGIYSPVAIEIYVSPEEGWLDLDGWKLELAIPYNYAKDYPLTTENSGIAENVVRITNEEVEEEVEGGLPMTDGSFTGTEIPAFSYRLYDPQNRRIDFAFSCYYQTDVFQKLSEMETPRLERLIVGAPGEAITPEEYTFEHGLLPQWHPANNPLGAAPAAPVLKRPGKIAGIWAELRKR